MDELFVVKQGGADVPPDGSYVAENIWVWKKLI